MIDRNQIAEAARYTDALVEEVGLDEWCRLQGVDEAALAYIATQRALRLVLIQYGVKVPTGQIDPQLVQVPVSGIEKIPSFSTIWMDAFAIGLAAGRLE